MAYALASQGVFWTIQGEGLLRGMSMVFVRFAGCSVGCPQCDTDYRVAERVSLDEVVRRVKATAPTTAGWVWLTGGEPTDHDLAPLVAALRQAHWSVALATSGVRVVDYYVDFLSVSPHQWDFVQRTGDELKVVVGLNGLTWPSQGEDYGDFDARFVMPLAGGDVQACVDWVLTHPTYRLTDQGHKSWGLP